ncbi:ABC transporter permease [Spiroplasma litorale]|uniref:ABC transporter permease n=1 Tax=Spiroplasma litorale TaxID=216942 RepID=A0A0K1W128_9MOLU|nr:ABC transporter permease [Spiroplasma litorale]AKX34029.1 ABC transporter permease [Spiroplasma litorale]
MNKQKPFFKNSFKNLIKNKIQLVAILVLVLLSSFIFTASFSSTSRIKKSFDNFISEKNSNLHDFVIDLENTTYENDYLKDNFKSISDENQKNNMLISYVQDKLLNSQNEFLFDRVETRNFSLSSNKSIKAITLNPYQNIDKFVVSKGMSLELYKNYTRATNDYTKSWVYINENFANQNDIKINDIVRLQDDEYGDSVLVKNSQKLKVDLSQYEKKDINLWKPESKYAQQNWFQVVGFGSSADFSTPVISSEKPLPDTKNEALFYLNPENFGYKYFYYDAIYPNNEFNLTEHENRRIWITNAELKANEKLKANSNSDIEVYFVGKFKNDGDINYLNEVLTSQTKAESIKLYSWFSNKLMSSTKIVYSKNDANYKFSSRVNFINQAIKMFEIIGYIVTGITLLIAIVMLILMIKNDLKKSFPQLGVLISLGYKKSSLLLSTSLYPFFVSIIGGLAGYFIGSSIQEVVVGIFDKFFQINILSFDFSWESILVNIFGIFILLELITLVTYFYVLNSYKPLEMIHYENRKITSKFNLLLKKIFTKRKKFDSRFKGAILSSSITKLASVFGVIGTSSFLITLGTITPGVLKTNVDKTYNNTKYDNITEYESPIYNSPKSFLKTYNPYSDVKDPKKLSSGELANMIIENNTSNKIYSPSEDLSTLNDLSYKNIDISYLQNFDLKIDFGDIKDEEQIKNFSKITIMNLWTDLKNYKFDKYWDKNALIKVLISDSESLEKIEDLESIRLFYLKYKNSIGLKDIFKNESRQDYFSEGTNYVKTGINDELRPNIIGDKELKVVGATNPLIEFTEEGTINNDDSLSTSLYDIKDSLVWKDQRINTIVSIYNWFQVHFYNNFQQAFLQGIYNNSPTRVKEYLLKNYSDPDGYYNVGFGTIPYNYKSDDIGILINSTIDNLQTKVYGVEKDNKTLNLVNRNGENLINSVFEDENNILVNESLAKRLNLSVGSDLNVNHLINALNYKNQELSIDSWDTNSLDAFDKTGNTSPWELYNNSIFSKGDQKVSDWKNKTINDEGTQTEDYVYKSNIDLTSENMVGPTLMSEALSNGSINKKINNVEKKYKVVGIVDKYGDNQAWINNDTAKKVSGFDKSEKLLFNLFMKEWENPKDKVGLENLITFIKDNKTNANAFESFKEFIKEPENNKFNNLFKNEYPIFNYKTSLDESITDITKGVSTIQLYGDYSMFGLNGGSTNQKTYNAFSKGSINNLSAVNEAKKVLERINNTVNSIIFLVIFVWTLLSAVIILLTINLVISENKKIISSMKVLGYKDLYIAKLFIFIYVPVVIVSALLGFALCYLAFYFALKTIYSTIVLPLVFQWWYFIPGIFGSWLLYVFSVNLSWFSLKRLNMLHIILGG